MSPAEQLRTLFDNVQQQHMSPDDAAAHLGKMRDMLVATRHTVEALHGGDAGAYELQQASLTAISGYFAAIDQLQAYLENGDPATGEDAVASAAEAEALLKSLQRRTDDAIENIINP